MFTSEKVADVAPLLLFSESDGARPDDLEVDLTDQDLGIGSLFPAPNTGNSILTGNRVEDAKAVDLSGGPANAFVRKLEADGFLELCRHGKCASRMTLRAPRRYPPIRLRAAHFSRSGVRSHCARTEFARDLGLPPVLAGDWSHSAHT